MFEAARSSRGFRGGAFWVLLMTVFSAGCSDDGAVGITTPSNNSPNAVFSANPTQIPAGDNHTTVVTLDGSGSSDPDGDLITFAWAAGPFARFVNGTDSRMPVAQVTFPGTGSYNVILTVRDARGGIDSANTTITTATSK